MGPGLAGNPAVSCLRDRRLCVPALRRVCPCSPRPDALWSAAVDARASTCYGVHRSRSGAANVSMERRRDLATTAATRLRLRSRCVSRRKSFRIEFLDDHVRRACAALSSAVILATASPDAARAAVPIAPSQLAALEPRPCDGCRLAVRCDTEHLGCVAFSLFMTGKSSDRWQVAPPVPTRERYEALLGEMA